MAIDEREAAVMRWLGGQGDGSALWNDVVYQFRDDAALADHLAALDARGLVEVLDPFGTEKRVVLTQRGVLYLLAHRAPQSERRRAPKRESAVVNAAGRWPSPRRRGEARAVASAGSGLGLRSDWPRT